MAGSVNKVIIVGNVGQDPEIKSFQNGGKVANLNVATSETWKDRNTGEKKEKTEWHRVAVFQEGLVGLIEQYVRKGSKLYIEGKLETRKWQDQNGVDRYSTEIVIRPFGGEMTMLDGRRNSDGQQQGQQNGQSSGYGGNGQQNGQSGGYGGNGQQNVQSGGYGGNGQQNGQSGGYGSNGQQNGQSSGYGGNGQQNGHNNGGFQAPPGHNGTPQGTNGQGGYGGSGYGSGGQALDDEIPFGCIKLI